MTSPVIPPNCRRAICTNQTKLKTIPAHIQQQSQRFCQVSQTIQPNSQKSNKTVITKRLLPPVKVCSIPFPLALGKYWVASALTARDNTNTVQHKAKWTDCRSCAMQPIHNSKYKTQAITPKAPMWASLKSPACAPAIDGRTRHLLYHKTHLNGYRR